MSIKNNSNNEKDKENDEFLQAIKDIQSTFSEKHKQKARCKLSASLLDEYSELHFKLNDEGIQTAKVKTDETMEYFNIELDLSNSKPKKGNMFRERLLKNDHLKPKPISILIKELKKNHE